MWFTVTVDHTGVDEMGVDKMGVDEMGVDEMGTYRLRFSLFSWVALGLPLSFP